MRLVIYQVSTGKKSLSLKHDIQDISLLNASEEHKLEITQFKSNAEQIVSDLERIDISFEQLQNASVRLKEMHIESSNGFLTSEERKLFQIEIAGIKEEILSPEHCKWTRCSWKRVFFWYVSGS